jgi:hypothetical protein
MIKQVPSHPITEALSALAPVVGVNFDLNSYRDSAGEADTFRFPRIDYAVILEDNSEYLPGQKLWRITLTIQLEYVTTEANFLCQCAETNLEESQAIQAIQKSYTDIIRTFITFLTNPTIIKPNLREEDFPFARFDWRFVNWITGFYFRRQGADELSGATARIQLSFLDVDSALCCTSDQLQKIQDLTIPDSVSFKLLQNEIDG